MATNMPQGDLVGWRTDKKHFQLGKTIKISSLDKKPYPTHAGCLILAHNLRVTQWWHLHLGLPTVLTTRSLRTGPTLLDWLNASI